MNGRVFFLCSLFMALIFSCKESTKSVNGGAYIKTDQGVIYSGDKSDEVIIRIVSQPPSLHPTNGRTRTRDRILAFTTQKLIALDIRSGKMAPVLATEVPDRFEEGSDSYTMEIDPDATWPDGKAILAEDVLFSYKAALCPLTENLQQKGYAEYLEDISIDDPKGRKITFSFSSYYMNNLALTSLFFIIDKRKYDPKGLLDEFSLQDLMHKPALEKNRKIKAWADEFNEAKLGLELEYINTGSGPYTLESWVTDQELVLKRRENYWGKDKGFYFHHQVPPSITFKILKDQDATELQLAEEKIDVAELGGESLRHLREDELVKKNYRLEVQDRATFVSLPLNHKPTSTGHQPFFIDKKVRQAITYALPIEDMLLSFIGDESFARRIGSPVSSMSPDYNPNLSLYEHDPEKAKSLLAEAGWEDTDGDFVLDKEVEGKKIPFNFTLIYPSNNQTLMGMATQIKEELEKIGINCTLDGVTGAVLQQKLWTHDYDMGMLGLGSSHLPYDFNQLFYSKNWPEGDNIYGFANEEADQLILAARVEKDNAKRKDMVHRIQEILYEEKPCIFLYAPTKKLAIHKRFNNAKAYSIVDHLIVNDFKVIRPE